MEDNPFQDPAVVQHSGSTGYATLDLYNPFDNNGTPGPPPPYEATPPAAPQALPATTPPARTTPTEPPRNYGSYSNQTAVNATTAELLKKQEELEKKAQELERRERELQAHSLGAGADRQKNWPPLPSFCPVGPCFYHDINIEISQRFQRIVTLMYYFWIFCAGNLLLNLISSLAAFCVSSDTGVGFGLAILWALLFTPCSFVCWYRPVYKAFRSDSSVNFFFFFFIFFAHCGMSVIEAIGIPGSGFSGWIVSLVGLRANIGVGVIMIINAILFNAQAVMGIFLLKRIHSLYRQTDASFQKAQAEFATGVMSNQAVRQAAATAAASAATNAAQGAFTAPR